MSDAGEELRVQWRVWLKHQKPFFLLEDRVGSMRLGKCPGSRGRILFCLFQPPGGSDCCSENVGYLNSAYLGTLLSRSYGLMDSCYSEEQHPPPHGIP